MKRKNRERINHSIVYAVLIVTGFLINLPIISMMGTALKEPSQALMDTNLLTWPPNFRNFSDIFSHTTFGRSIFNSAFVSVTVTVLCMFIASLAGYAISRFKGRVFSWYLTLLLVLQMFPGVLLLIPLFVIFKGLGLINTLFSVILSYLTLNLPFSIWMLKGFFDTIPTELDEAATIDGCGPFSTYYRIILPISLPGLSSVAIFTFLNSWNEYLLASIFLRKESIRTITVGLQQFVQQFSSQWGQLMSASTLATIPTLIFLIVAQKYLIEGLTAGSVKG
jgi:multiple sugar transport system permease protein